jgi:hypothetical protein
MGKAHFLKGVFGCINGATRAEQAEQQRLNFVAISTAIRCRKAGRAEFAAAGARDTNIDGNAAYL